MEEAIGERKKTICNLLGEVPNVIDLGTLRGWGDVDGGDKDVLAAGKEES